MKSPNNFDIRHDVRPREVTKHARQQNPKGSSPKCLQEIDHKHKESQVTRGKEVQVLRNDFRAGQSPGHEEQTTQSNTFS